MEKKETTVTATPVCKTRIQLLSSKNFSTFLRFYNRRMKQQDSTWKEVTAEDIGENYEAAKKLYEYMKKMEALGVVNAIGEVQTLVRQSLEEIQKKNEKQETTKSEN